MNSVWSEQRLTRLFERYNRKFFAGRLSGWTVSHTWDEPFDRYKDGAYFTGYCNLERKRIFVHLNCQTDYEVRTTLLHEMAHAVTNDPQHKIGGAWAVEIERLRAAGARVPSAAYHIGRLSRAVFERYLAERQLQKACRCGRGIHRGRSKMKQYEDEMLVLTLKAAERFLSDVRELPIYPHQEGNVRSRQRHPLVVVMHHPSLRSSTNFERFSWQ